MLWITYLLKRDGNFKNGYYNFDNASYIQNWFCRNYVYEGQKKSWKKNFTISQKISHNSEEKIELDNQDNWYANCTYIR